MGKRNRNEAALQPCCTRRGEVNKGGRITTVDKVEDGKNDLDSTHQFSQTTTGEMKIEDEEINICRIPLSLSHTCENVGDGGVTFVLEKASLTLAYVGKRYQILSSDEHADYLRKKNLNPYDYRPDIVHEALLQIMDSRLRMAGRLKAVYIHTNDGVLIRVEPYSMIPRTLGRFCNMIAELLQTLNIKAKGSRKKLLRVVANPVTKYLSPQSHKIGLSFSSEKAVQLREYVSGINCDENVVFVVGVMAHGKIECDYIEDLVSAYTGHASCGRRLCVSLSLKLCCLFEAYLHCNGEEVVHLLNFKLKPLLLTVF